MSRIGQTFHKLRKQREKALITYVMAGHPNLRTTREIVLTLAASGADIIELGVPFSDPIADGPIIQKAAQHALNQRVTLSGILHLVEEIRQTIETPLVLMSYYNPVFRMGVGTFLREASRVGLDGMILPDLPLEEAESLMERSAARDLDMILLAAPTSPKKRLKRIIRMTRGFLYYVSLTGVTGSGLSHLTVLKRRLREIRNLTQTPVAAGFGISTADQAALIAREADGVIIGSALVRCIEDARSATERLAGIKRLTRTFKRAMTP